ncbi:DJ-1 family glyoxalase III [Helicobacter sp. 23-1045]
MKVLVPILRGFEEIELVSIVDILRRSGLCVVLAGREKSVCGAHNIILQSECDLSAVNLAEFSAIALAGGYDGMQNLCNDNFVIKALQELNAQGKLVSAICASPIVLGKAGVLKNKFTCYPSCENAISSSAKYCAERVVIDENIITANGPTSATLFALAIVEYLLGREVRDKIAKELLLD